MTRSHLAGVAQGRRTQLPCDICFERQHGLGLRAIALEHDRQRFVDGGQRLVDGLFPQAA